MIFYFRLIKIFLVSGLTCLAIAVVCPDSSQWNLRTKARCNSSRPSYNCLYDESIETFVEFCTRQPDFQRPGYKFIIRGNLDGIHCEKNRYQPIKFWTNGSNSCILAKTGCNELGQVIHDEGNSTSDRTCRCDYTKGFAFVKKPKQECFCHPSLEDCSCLMKPCDRLQVLTPDNNCIQASDWDGIFKCPVISKTMPTIETLQKTVRCPTISSDLQKFSIMTMVEKRHTALIVTVLVAVTLIIGIIFLSCGKQIENNCINMSTLHTMEDKMVDKIQLVQQEGFQKMESEIKKQMDARMQLEKDDTMFKMKLKVNFKEILTTINSKKIAENLTLTESEKKVISSCLGRIKANKELMEIVRYRGLDTYKEFMDELRQHNLELATKIENTKDSEYQEELEEELEKIYNEKIPENVRKFHDSQTQEWIVNEEMIIETKVSMDVFERLEKGNCICLVGRPGSGKSSIIRHVALKFVEAYEAEDFDIIPVVIEPSKMLQYYNEKRNQIFILDDFCGKDKVNNQLLDVWKLDIEKMLNIINQNDCFTDETHKTRTKRTKILVSCSKSVYDSNKFEPLKKRLDAFVFDLSKFSLTHEERENMIRKYAPTVEEKDYRQEGTSSKKIDFPLLCKLSTGKSIEEINRLFSDPIQSIKDDLKKVQKGDRFQFCAIALCTLCNNKFETRWLNLNCETYDSRIKKAVIEMCLEFNLDLNIPNDFESIQDQFDNKQMDWLCKSGDTYHHIHDEIFNIASILCGKTYQRCFINHAPSSFIANRFNFQDHCEGLITLKVKYQKLYFDRLFRDLENGVNYSTFQNIQLKNENYRKKFIEYCWSRKFKFKEILENLKQNSVKMNLERNTVEDKAPLCRKDTVSNLLDSKAPLIDCSCQGYDDMVHLLLQMNYDANEQDTFERSALFVASAKGHIEVVKRLVEHKPKTYKDNVENEVDTNISVDIDKCNNQNRTPLHVACQEMQLSVVKYLIQKGANVFAVDVNGYSPLHMACLSESKELVEHLLMIYAEKGKETEIEKNDILGKTPIILASSKGEKQIVQLLLQYKAKISATDKKGFTSLIAACMNGYTQTAKVLIDNKANISHTDNDGRTALFIASEKGHRKIVEMLIEIDKNIIKKGDWHQKSPFYIACAEGKHTIANMLFEGGADINCLDEDNKSPIYAASQKGHEKVVRFLLEKNANIDKTDSHQNLPLHIACKGGFFEIVKLLHSHQRCLSIEKNQWDETAIDIARKQGHQNIVDYLNEQENKLNNANTEITLVETSNS